MKPDFLLSLACSLAWAVMAVVGAAFPLWFRATVIDCGLRDVAAELVLTTLEYTSVVLLLVLEAVVFVLYAEWFVDYGPLDRG